MTLVLDEKRVDNVDEDLSHQGVMLTEVYFDMVLVWRKAVPFQFPFSNESLTENMIEFV